MVVGTEPVKRRADSRNAAGRIGRKQGARRRRRTVGRIDRRIQHALQQTKTQYNTQAIQYNKKVDTCRALG